MKKIVKKLKKKKSSSVQVGKFNPTNFINRELSWLEFNRRVLNEAQDSRTPLLERVRFLAIYTSNLDEFIMKRVGGLKTSLESDYHYKSTDGMTAIEQLEQIREEVLKQNESHEKAFVDIKKELKKEMISLLTWKDLDGSDKKFCEEYFDSNIFPVLTPLSVDPGKPFPFISNLSYSFGIYLKSGLSDELIFSRVKVPDNIHYWVELPSVEGKRLINTAEIIEHHLRKLYHGMAIVHAMPFRVTRNADWEHDDEDVEDLLELVEESVNSRRLQEPIRIEVLKNAHKDMLSYLMTELKLGEDDLYIYDNQLDYLSMHSVADLNVPKLKYSDWRPITQGHFYRHDFFEKIKEKDRLVHHPYENFQSSVERFITEASHDPAVLSIKMTLYRTADNSKFIKSLIEAAENGKQVACLIELKARFDEKRNIYWARKMEQAGVHVVYGVVGLKTHTKIAMVVRREKSGELLQYAHIATGNYNSKTAKLYTDLGLFTVNKKLNLEVNEVFNYLTGTSLKIDYKELLVAPINAKSTFLKLIARQAKLAQSGKKVKIIAKMNSLDDAVISEALYAASNAGVEIILMVRGLCCLKPGVKDLSENIKVISVIGRFLEHSRIFFFSDGKGEWSGDYYIGSADWMHRNMHSRVEVITPIYAEDLKAKLAEFLDIVIKDQRSAWDIHSDGSSVQRKGSELSGTHNVMMRNTLSEMKK